VGERRFYSPLKATQSDPARAAGVSAEYLRWRVGIYCVQKKLIEIAQQTAAAPVLAAKGGATSQ